MNSCLHAEIFYNLYLVSNEAQIYWFRFNRKIYDSIARNLITTCRRLCLLIRLDFI